MISIAIIVIFTLTIIYYLSYNRNLNSTRKLNISKAHSEACYIAEKYNLPFDLAEVKLYFDNDDIISQQTECDVVVEYTWSDIVNKQHKKVNVVMMIIWLKDGEIQEEHVLPEIEDLE